MDMEHNIDGFRSTIDIESRQNIMSKSGIASTNDTPKLGHLLYF